MKHETRCVCCGKPITVSVRRDFAARMLDIDRIEHCLETRDVEHGCKCHHCETVHVKAKYVAEAQAMAERAGIVLPKLHGRRIHVNQAEIQRWMTLDAMERTTELTAEERRMAYRMLETMTDLDDLREDMLCTRIIARVRALIASREPADRNVNPTEKADQNDEPAEPADRNDEASAESEGAKAETGSTGVCDVVNLVKMIKNTSRALDISKTHPILIALTG